MKKNGLRKSVWFKLVVASGLLASISTFAGTKDGGGGKGVLCGDRLRVLDLYEAEVIRGLPPGPEFGTLEEADAHYCPKVRRYFEAGVHHDSDSYCPESVKKIFRGLANWMETPLPLSDDATLPALPAGCTFVQVAFWDDLQDRVEVNQELWAKLAFTDQVALMFHEVLYHSLRLSNRNLENSDEARRVVGNIFLSPAYPSRFEESKNGAPYYSCAFGGDLNLSFSHSFMVAEGTQNGVHGLVYSFDMLQGKFHLERMTHFAPGRNLSDFSLENFDVRNPQGEVEAHYEYFRAKGNAFVIRASGLGPEAEGYCQLF